MRFVKQRDKMCENRVVGILMMQVGYAEKIASVWTKATEETSQYDRESSR